MVDELGAMDQGFWWEFMAQCHCFGYTMMEHQVNHRQRAAGQTQVHRLKKLPGIGYRHFRALFQILEETNERRVAIYRQNASYRIGCRRKALRFCRDQ
jgi:hypothetical protein